MHDFSLHRPSSLDDAVARLAADPDAKPLAGGHSLIPLMKHRLAAPSGLVDLSRIAGLRQISVDGDDLVIGAMASHEDVGKSAAVIDTIPALAILAGGIGDPAVRRRGTIGGSLATNDPSADYPAAAVALNAQIETTKRRIAADDFFQGVYTTALEPDEIIVAVRFSKPDWSAYNKFRHAASRFALVGVFIARRHNAVRVAVTGAGANGVFRASLIERALEEDFSADSLRDVRLSNREMGSDMHASAPYRAHLVRVLTIRALAS